MSSSVQRRLNEALKVMDTSFHYKEGIIKISEHETFEHALAKFLYCWELKNQGINFYTEAIFRKDKLRSDIFVPFWNEAVEIVKSETERSILLKSSIYPVKVRAVYASEIIKSNEVLIRKCLKD